MSKPFNVSWEELHRDTRALAWRLSEINKSWDAIVCITRGGLVPAAIISRELGLRKIETIGIASYQTYDEQSELKFTKDLPPEILATQGENILVIDDLTDTGNTFKKVQEILPKAHYATVYIKPQGKPRVHTYITEVSQETWIYFPWDMGLSYQTPIKGDNVA